jgi:hypothetical protein
MVKPILILTSLFTLVLGALIVGVSALAHDADYFTQVEATFAPGEGCPAPCFAGIRPGITSVDDAVDILKAHEWVAAVDVTDRQMLRVAIDWTWSGQQPDFITGEGHIELWNNTVQSISIPTRISYSDFLNAFGSPQQAQLDYLFHYLSYDSAGITARAEIVCRNLWHTPVTIDYSDRPLRGDPYDLQQMKRRACTPG